MVLLPSFFNLFLAFSAPGIRRNVRVETLDIRQQTIQPVVINQQKIGLHRSLFLTSSHNDNAADRTSLQTLNLEQLCGLLEHCQLPDVRKFVTENQLTGMHLSRGIDAAEDLVSLGMKAVQARTLFSLISEWKKVGLPHNFSSQGSETRSEVKTTSSPAAATPQTTEPQEADPAKVKFQRRQAMEEDFYGILRENKSPMDAHTLKNEQFSGSDLLGAVYLSCLLHQGCATINAHPQGALKIATSQLSALTSEATAGDPFAQHMLGRYYAAGLGVEQNWTEALKYFELAASQGHAESQVFLGQTYLNGKAGKRDDLKAAACFTAAVHSNIEAQFRVGQMMVQGWGMPVNLELGVHFVKRAADAGHVHAQLYMAEIHDDSSRVGLEVDEEVVSKYLKLAADRGLPEAQFLYADTMYSEHEHNGHCPEAFEYYKLAADQGHVEAQYEVGCMLYDNEEPEAFVYFRSAANAGHKEALYYAGRCNAQGLGVDKNPEEAVRLYHLAAQHDSMEAQVALGECFEHGIGVTQDKHKAKYYFKKVADAHYEEVAWTKVVRLTAEGY